MSMQYTYSPTQNNGQITQQTDVFSGEQVSYTYDRLQRLVTATTTDSSWGLSFSYDGFGNRTGSTVTKGAGPSGSGYVDPATNRMGGYSYDANGNQTLAPNGVTLSYDVENRLVTTGNGESYAYDTSGRRLWKRMPNGTEEIYFYGASGQKLGTYRTSSYQGAGFMTVVDLNLSFGSRLLVSRSVSVVRDRLGSNRAGGVKYYPYGEEQGVGTGNDKEKFGTYYRDGTTGLDYAQNRYYASTLARFLTPDPYSAASAGPSDPQTWNRYAYTRGDPINRYDPSGFFDEQAGDETPTGCGAPDGSVSNRIAFPGS